MKLISLKSDFMFKEVFSNEMVRKQFVSDVLGIPLEDIKSLRIANPYLWKRFGWQKQGILDMVLELNDDTNVNLELQVRKQEHWVKRKLFYLGKLYTGDLRRGQDYGRLRKCVSISILDFQLVEGEGYHTTYLLRDKNGKELTDLLELHIIELRKELKGTDAANDWIRLFNAEKTEDLDMIRAKSMGMEEAIRELKVMSLGKSLRYILESHMKAKRDRRAEDEYVWNSGKAEGKAEEILDFLGELGEIPAELKEKIMAERNMEILRDWMKAAARAESIDQFREKFQI